MMRVPSEGQSNLTGGSPVMVYDGVGGPTIWKDVKDQSLLGNGYFVNRLIDYVRGHEEVREIPKSQRYVSRPTLEKIFKDVKGRKGKRDLRIVDAVIKWRYN